MCSGGYYFPQEWYKVATTEQRERQDVHGEELGAYANVC